MSPINVLFVGCQNSRAEFNEPLRFGVRYECLGDLKDGARAPPPPKKRRRGTVRGVPRPLRPVSPRETTPSAPRGPEPDRPSVAGTPRALFAPVVLPPPLRLRPLFRARGRTFRSQTAPLSECLIALAAGSHRRPRPSPPGRAGPRPAHTARGSAAGRDTDPPPRAPLAADLEWKVTYVGSAESDAYDQELTSALVGPVVQGMYEFVLECDPIDAARIPASDLVGVTVVLVTCSYRGNEFIRVGEAGGAPALPPPRPPLPRAAARAARRRGSPARRPRPVPAGYYVNVDYESEELRENRPPKPDLGKLWRCVATPRGRGGAARAGGRGRFSPRPAFPRVPAGRCWRTSRG